MCTFAEKIQASNALTAESGKENPPSLGKLVINGEVVEIYPYAHTAEASEVISQWIQAAAEGSLPDGDMTALLERVIVVLSNGEEMELELNQLMQEIDAHQNRELPQTPLPSTQSEHLPLTPPKTQHSTLQPHTSSNQAQDTPKAHHQPAHTSSQRTETPTPPPSSRKVFSSLFALAKAVNSEMTQNARKAPQAPSEPVRKEGALQPQQVKAEIRISASHTQEQQEREEQEHKEKEQRQQQEQEQEQDEQQERKRPFSLFAKHKKKGPQAAIAGFDLETSKTPSYHAQSQPIRTAESVLQDVGSLHFRFMALMSRILGQAEAEGHQLYQKIKTRTDQVDLLIRLQSKINNEKGAIDWSKNEEAKALLDQARAIGVEIPEGKTKWKKDELPLLKENISMRKDSMEKMTQLERTDMQRYLQEASQCHQARSNILKLMKEVVDTIIHNMRP